MTVLQYQQQLPYALHGMGFKASTGLASGSVYALLTKRDGRGRVSARGPSSTDQEERGPIEKTPRVLILFQYGPQQAQLNKRFTSRLQKIFLRM